MLRSIIRAGLLAGIAATVPLAAKAAAAVPEPAPAALDGAGDEDPIVVSGVHPVNEASAGTKSSLPLAETAQSISVISGVDLQDLGLSNLNQALRYVAGITPETRGANAEIYDQFKLRGFDAPRYLDGLKVFQSVTGYANAQIDVSRIERIEVVKGPASVLYGQSSPGGLVAITSKLPLDQAFYGAVAGTYGSYNLYRADVDIGGRVAPGVLWRVYGSANGADTQQSFGKRRRETGSVAMTFGAGSDTTFTVLGAYSHDPDNGNYGSAPAFGTLLANPNGKIRTDFADGEPGDFFRRNQGALTYIFTHRFGDWAFRSSGRYQYVSTRLGAIYQTGAPTDAALTTFSRSAYASRETLNNWTYDNQLTGKVETGPITHDLLFGLDRQVLHSLEYAAFGSTVLGQSVSPINAFDPVYGTTIVPRTPDEIGGASNLSTHQRQTGIYAQDQISVGGLRLTLSGRQDWARTASATEIQKDRKFTWRVSGLYRTSLGLAPYVSYSTSFEPQIGTLINPDGTLSAAKPSLGNQIEAGVKYQPPGTQILVTAAWFRIEQTNLLTGIPGTSFSTQAGKVRSQGFELEATVPLPHGFAAKAAFSHQNVKTVRDENPDNIGRGLIGVGKGNAAFNLDWSPQDGPLVGLTVGGGVRWVDHVYGGYANLIDGPGISTPTYTLFDALLRYDLGKADPRLKGIEVGLTAANIFDKTYLTSCYLSYVGWCWYGQRRTVQGTIGFRW